MITEIGGSLDPAGLRIGVAASRWNEAITSRLLQGALRRLEELKVDEVTVVRVPGALELPVATRALIDSGCHAVVVIAAIVKGETDHYEIVVRESAAGVSRVAIETGVPVTNAILAIHQVEDAMARSGPDDSNKGAEAVDAALMMANVLRQLANR